MFNSTSNNSTTLSLSQPFNHTAWQPTDDQGFDWRNNPYIVTLIRILLVAFFVFLIRMVIQYFRLPEEVSSGSQAAIDTVLGGVCLEDLELGLRTTASVGNQNDLPSSGGDRHVRRNDLDNESHD